MTEIIDIPELDVRKAIVAEVQEQLGQYANPHTRQAAELAIKLFSEQYQDQGEQ